MYEAYFRLQKRPFAATSDASCAYAPESIQSILDELARCAASGQGVGVLVAAAGTGKTHFCRRILSELDGGFTGILLANANFSNQRALLQAILFELGRRYSGIEDQELRLDLISTLKDLALSGRPAVLVVDEAHLLNEQMLEELRALASLTEGEQPLVRLILVGQMALEMQLIEPVFEALNQRIVRHAYLEPLTRQQSREYIEYRVQWAGGEVAQLFEGGAVDLIAEACNGLPRCLNQLCDHSLLLAFAQERSQVTRDIAQNALDDLKQLPLQWNDSVAGDALECEIGEAGDDDELVVDEWQPETSVAPGRTTASGDEPLASFEIGDDSPDGWTIAADIHALSECATSVADEQRSAETATLSITASADGSERNASLSQESPTSVRVFQEEYVDDRYASLDLNGTRVSRTFEDTALSHTWRSAPPAAIVERRSPPAVSLPEASLPLSAECSAAPVTGGHAETDDGTREVGEPADESARPFTVGRDWTRGFEEDDVIDAESWLLDSIGDSSEDTEDELGDNVLDVCLDVQNSLGQWWESKPADVRAAASGESERDSGAAGAAAPAYDVVEPERAESTNRTQDRAASDRYVPKPNYRHVFSTLRRRIGRSPQNPR